MEASKNQDISVFNRFRENFPDLDLTSTNSQVTSFDPFLLNLRNLVISLLGKILSQEELSGYLPHGDYRDLLEFTLFTWVVYIRLISSISHVYIRRYILGIS